MYLVNKQIRVTRLQTQKTKRTLQLVDIGIYIS